MSVVVRLEARPGDRAASVHEAEAAEAVYDELLDHAHGCGHCWPWRDALWQAAKLCATGRELIAAYAEAVVSASVDEDDANAALSVRLGVEPAPALRVVGPG